MNTTKNDCRKRYDLTEWLTHIIHKPYYYNTHSEGFQTSFDILKKILNEGILYASFSERTKGYTIYGEHPAVCFTEMPLSSINAYAYQRDDATRIDYYGIAIKRDLLFRYGARPVIYGLTGDKDIQLCPSENKKKIICKSILPKEEQYRFVRTNITMCESTNIDWMHEREWRWPANGDERHLIFGNTEGIFIKNIPEITILVNTNEEKDTIEAMINDKDKLPEPDEHNSKPRLWNVISFDEIDNSENSFENCCKIETVLNKRQSPIIL